MSLFLFFQKKQSSLTRAVENIQINEEDNEIRYFVLLTVCSNKLGVVLSHAVPMQDSNICREVFFKEMFRDGLHLPFSVFQMCRNFWPSTVSSLLRLYL